MTKNYYVDQFTCPKCGYSRTILRRVSSKGRKVKTFCEECDHESSVVAGKRNLNKPVEFVR